MLIDVGRPICDGVNENDPHRFRYLNIWFPVSGFDGGTISLGVGSKALKICTIPRSPALLQVCCSISLPAALLTSSLG